MDQAVFYLRIFPGTEAEYDRRHAEIWPELVDEIRESGLRNFSGFRRGTKVGTTRSRAGTTSRMRRGAWPKAEKKRLTALRDVIADHDDAGNSSGTTGLERPPTGLARWLVERGLFTRHHRRRRRLRGPMRTVADSCRHRAYGFSKYKVSTRRYSSLRRSSTDLATVFGRWVNE